jgi:hypothetical protein
MLLEQDFSDSDLNAVKSIPKVSKLFALFFLFLCLPVAFIPGLLGYSKKGYFDWLATLILLIVFGCCYLYIVITGYIAHNKDVSRQIKLVGQLFVKAKSSKKNETILYFDSPQIKKLDVYSKQIFDKVEVGDILSIEISKFTKCLFRFEKNGQNLLNGR